MSELEVFDGTRLIEVAACHHPISALPRTLTGLGRFFLGVAQLRAQSKLFELEAQQMAHDRAYRTAFVAAQRDLGLATIENRRAELKSKFESDVRADALRALEIRAKDAQLEREHQQRLLLIEDSYRLSRLVIRQREREVRTRLVESQQALAVSTAATRGVQEALQVATTMMVRPKQSLVQEQWTQGTVTQLASHLTELGTSATRMVGLLIESSSRSADIAFRGLYEVRG